MTETVFASQSSLNKWLGFSALCAGMFMAVLDIQIVVTSLSVIEAALKIGTDKMSWVQTSYLIAEIIAIPLTGLLMRVFSLRWLVTGAISFFTLASIGCAASTGFEMLIAFRVLQGLAGGVLIPVVFSAVFLLFRPGTEQTIATTMAGVLAVLAPALGPISGGLVTEMLSWHWLFLINIIPGVVTAALASICLPRQPMRLPLLASLDWVSLVLIAAALASLEIGLKEAPGQGWLSPTVALLLIGFALAMLLAIRRKAPVVDFNLLSDRNLAFGCAVSFILGLGLYGSVYLLPLFLAYVHHQGPIDIGMTLLVTGVAQLVAAPISVLLDSRISSRLLSAVGFAGFTLGLGMSGFETVASGYDELFWAQIVRGGSIALCILPVTRFALGFLPLQRVSDASGLAGKSIAVNRGTLEDTEVTKIAPADADIQRYSDYSGVISAFLSGQAQLMVVGNDVGATILAQNPAIEPVEKFLLLSSPSQMAVRKGETRLQQALNTALVALKADGGLNGLAVKWLKQPLAADF